MLDPNLISEIKERADIFDVISEYVVLRKQGQGFVGLCPFHDERTPSFSVSTQKQRYYCFGCQAKGDVIQFLQDINKRSFKEVVVDLAEKHQVVIQDLTPEEKAELKRQAVIRDELLAVLSSAAFFFQTELNKPSGSKALNYLRDRGLSPETIEKFNLGYANRDGASLYRHLVMVQGFSSEIVEMAGLIKCDSEGDRYYDVYRDRVVVPIHDSEGKVIGFGARTLGNESPKYLNSPDTPVFKKSKVLFGIDKAKVGIVKAKRVLVVEGFFDAIALHAAGINYAVASMGTALTDSQVRLGLRYTNSNALSLNFDNDKAGKTATQRAIDNVGALAYKGEVNLSIVALPDCKDVDEYLRSHGVEKYQQLLDNATPWIHWQIDKITRDRDLKQPGDYQTVSNALIGLLKNLGNQNLQSYYTAYCAELLSCGNSLLIPTKLESLVSQLRGKDPSRTRKVLDRGNIDRAYVDPLTLAERLLLRVFLHCPDERASIVGLLDAKCLSYTCEAYRFLWQRIIQVGDTPDLLLQLQAYMIDSSEDVTGWNDLMFLGVQEERDLKNPGHAVYSAIAVMERIARDKRCKELLLVWQQSGLESDYEAFLKEKSLQVN